MDPIVFILALALLIFVHELGHFLTAKKLGMYVEEFALGFPPRVAAKKFKETVYSLNLIPIGGYVKIFGESEQEIKEADEDDPDYKKKLSRAFYSQPRYKRVIVLLAGVGMNFLFGWLIISLVFVRGVAVPGDRVEVVNVAGTSPAAEAGLRKGDIIMRVDGATVETSEELIDSVGEGAERGEAVRIVWQRDGKEISSEIVPRADPPAGQGAIGVVISDFVEKKYSIVEAPWMGLTESVRISRFFYSELIGGVGRFVSGEPAEVAVSGPVGIYGAYQEREGLFEKLLLTGLISLNLALINILPFPALDGGHLLFIGIEAIIGREISIRRKQRLTYAGLLFLLLLIGLVTVRDILMIL